MNYRCENSSFPGSIRKRNPPAAQPSQTPFPGKAKVSTRQEDFSLAAHFLSLY